MRLCLVRHLLDIRFHLFCYWRHIMFLKNVEERLLNVLSMKTFIYNYDRKLGIIVSGSSPSTTLCAINTYYPIIWEWIGILMRRSDHLFPFSQKVDSYLYPEFTTNLMACLLCNSIFTDLGDMSRYVSLTTKTVTCRI